MFAAGARAALEVLRTSLPPAAPPPGPCRQELSHSGWRWPAARRAGCRPQPRLVPPSRARGGCCRGERGAEPSTSRGRPCWHSAFGLYTTANTRLLLGEGYEPPGAPSSAITLPPTPHPAGMWLPPRPPTNLYCCGDRRGLLLPLLLTCSTVLLTSSWPTCSIPLAELVLIMVGLLSRGKLLSASAACNEQRGAMGERLCGAVGFPWGSRGCSVPLQCCHDGTAPRLCAASTGSGACPQQGRAGCVLQGMGMSRASSPGSLH